MDDPLAIILAAGKSTRMKSDVPKVLHEIFGRPMIDYVLDAARGAGVKRVVLVVGHKAETVQAAMSHHRDVEFALQAEQLGTGHAVMMCERQLADHDGPVLVLAGDTPLLQAASLRGLLDDLRENAAACVIGTAVTEANQGLGRIVRDGEGTFTAIVEERDATPPQKEIREINTGCYAFDGRLLLQALGKVRPTNKQAEYYLTDCPAILLREGHPVLATERFDVREAIGVNTRVQLAEVHRAMQEACLQRLMLQGVTIVDPRQVCIDPRAEIGRDTVIFPFTSISGAVRIGENCRLGPHAALRAPLDLPAGSVLGPGAADEPL